MKLKYLYIFLFLIATLLGCRKQKYPPSTVENDTVYGFKATIGNEAVSFEAGKDNYYMYSAYKQDSNKVYNFTGTLRQIDCSDCRKSLQVQINDFRVSDVDGPMQADSALRTRSYSILNGVSVYEVPFTSHFNKTAASYLWDFGDGAVSTDANPVHTFAKSGNYLVKLKIKSTNDYENTVQHTENISADPGNLRTYIAVAGTASNTILFEPTVIGGKAPYKYSWSFDNGTSSTLRNPSCTYKYRGSYTVLLRVTDDNGQVASTSYNLVTQNDPSSCAANYVAGTIKPVANSVGSLSLSKIIITWIDANGVKYSSNNDLQPITSSFAITSVEDGELNEYNQPTKKLHLKFDCTVYNGTKPLAIKDAEATVSVAYNRN